MQKRLTKRGYLRLKKEFDDLSQKERPKVVLGVSNAALEGDRSENAEYIYGKKRLREIDKRLQYLSGLLKDVTVIDSSLIRSEQVNFGCKVTLKNDNGEKKVYTIVGEGEADLKEQTISIKAPMALALLGKVVGDVVEVELSKGTQEIEILKIENGNID